MPAEPSSSAGSVTVDDPERGLRLAEIAKRVAEVLGDLHLLGRSLQAMGVAFRALTRHDEATAVYARAGEFACGCVCRDPEYRIREGDVRCGRQDRPCLGAPAGSLPDHGSRRQHDVVAEYEQLRQAHEVLAVTAALRRFRGAATALSAPRPQSSPTAIRDSSAAFCRRSTLWADDEIGVSTFRLRLDAVDPEDLELAVTLVDPMAESTESLGSVDRIGRSFTETASVVALIDARRWLRVIGTVIETLDHGLGAAVDRRRWR